LIKNKDIWIPVTFCLIVLWSILIPPFVVGGTDANWQSFEGITPLHLACEQGNVESVILLLENGADANLHDHMDTYPLFTGIIYTSFSTEIRPVEILCLK